MWGMDWIDLAQHRDRWRAVVSAGNFLTSRGPVSFSEGVLPAELVIMLVLYNPDRIPPILTALCRRR